MPDCADKLARLRSYLRARKLDGVVLATRANIAWLSGGGDAHVVAQSEAAFAALVVTARSAWLLANAIEMGRLTAEEPFAAFQPKVRPWTQPLDVAVARLAGGKAAAWASDLPEATGLAGLPADFAYVCRAQLDEAEIRRYKALGRDCALAIETVARQLHPGDSEVQAEADLARHLLARGIQPACLLVAYDQRILKYRHPTPTLNRLKRHAMLVVCGQRQGLVASLTRFVHFGAMPRELIERHLATCRVEAALWEATVAGRPYGEVLRAGLAQYKAEGYAKEWELHHQGGPTGYAGREFCVAPDETRPVLDRQAVAWNPSITGAKSEDTFILQDGVRTVVTASTAEWPTVTVATPAGAKLVRPAVLER